VWWLVFTAIDLYIGVVLLDMLARGESVPTDKRTRLFAAKKITLVLLALTILGILLKLLATRRM
jgi:hypothetical protein